MASFEVTSAMSDNRDHPLFLPELKDNNMQSTVLPKEAPVSKKLENPSLSRRNAKKLRLSKLLNRNHFTCDLCGEVFLHKSVFTMHKKNHTAKKALKCNLCDRQFNQKNGLRRHRQMHLKKTLNGCPDLVNSDEQKMTEINQPTEHSKLLKQKKRQKHHKCEQCSEAFYHKTKLLYHLCTVSPKPNKASLNDVLNEKGNYLKRRNILSRTTFYSNEKNDKDLDIFLNMIKRDLLDELNYQINEKEKIKWYANIQVILSRLVQEGDLETAIPSFYSEKTLELTNENLPLHVEDASIKILNSYKKFLEPPYGWRLEKILYLELTTAKYDMM